VNDKTKWQNLESDTKKRLLSTLEEIDIDPINKIDELPSKEEIIKRIMAETNIETQILISQLWGYGLTLANEIDSLISRTDKTLAVLERMTNACTQPQSGDVH